MISVDISNVWGELSLPELLGMEKEIFDAHGLLTENDRDWLVLPAGEEIERILASADKIRQESDVCVVAGDASAARGAMELLQGQNRNFGRGKGDPQIFYAGTNLSTRHWNELVGLLEGKDFSVIVISGAVLAPETAIALRGLRWMLERKYGTDAAAGRIYAITDPEEGSLCQMAKEEGWECFFRQEGALSPAELLPMAAAGLDIRKIVKGAAEARAEFDLRSFENPVWLYCGVRLALERKGKRVEVLESFEPDFEAFGRWWQQSFDGAGPFPAAAELPSMQWQGGAHFFETMVRFDGPEKEYVIGAGWKNLDGLNGLEGKTLDQAASMAFEAGVAAREEQGISVITMDCGALTEETVGALFGFFRLTRDICRQM